MRKRKRNDMIDVSIDEIFSFDVTNGTKVEFLPLCIDASNDVIDLDTSDESFSDLLLFYPLKDELFEGA